MKQVTLDLSYRTLNELMDLIDEPNGSACKRLLKENRKLFEDAWGSTHNHQAWKGGYIDHITDGLNYGRLIYELDTAIGRPVPFSLSDILLIYFLHDKEKPWRIVIDDNGDTFNIEGLSTKAEFKLFREKKISEYGITLTPYQHNALTYVEGEIGVYSSKQRTMNELAAFCHRMDVKSSREWHDYPKADGDEWQGASRFRF